MSGSNIENVKLGVCKILFDGEDLGYTKGGVEVTVTTETKEVMVDQFGNTPINEYIMGRKVSAKVPLAETTLPNLVRIMPGATLVQLGGAFAAGTMTVATNPTNGQTVTINGKTVTFRTSAVAGLNEVTIGGTAAITATNLAAFVTNTSDTAINRATAAAVTAVVTFTHRVKGVIGNAYTLATGTAAAAVTVSGAILTGGVNGTATRVDVPTAIGTNLLSIARALVLHPIGLPDADKSEDFTIYKTATAGALSFAYKLDDERIYEAEFKGYPDATGRLFGIGDPAAV